MQEERRWSRIKNYELRIMNVEFEATFKNISKDEFRDKLRDLGAEMVKEEFLQKRSTFNVPRGCKINESWLRVRDEVDKITLTFKSGGKQSAIEDQKEIELKVDNYEEAKKFLEVLGCRKKSYQETKREIWKLDEVEVMIDEWPFLEPFAEIEGKNEEEVKKASEKLGFDYNDAVFGPVSILYSEKYGVTEKFVNNEVKEILFNGDNPFIR